MKRYLKKFIVLKGSLLYYYGDDKSMKPDGIIPLQDCSCKSSGSSDKQHKFLIETTTRTHNFSCESEQEMKDWMSAIENQIRK